LAIEQALIELVADFARETGDFSGTHKLGDRISVRVLRMLQNVRRRRTQLYAGSRFFWHC
jgi:hypothetical protein